MCGTMDGQNRRTVDLVIHLIGTGQLTLHGLLYLLIDTQSADQLKKLAEIASENPTTLALASNNLDRDQLRELAIQICDALENDGDISLGKYDLRYRQIVNQLRQKVQE